MIGTLFTVVEMGCLPPPSCLAIQEESFSEYTESRKTEREERKINIMAVFVAGEGVVRFDWNQ